MPFQEEFVCVDDKQVFPRIAELLHLLAIFVTEILHLSTVLRIIIE